MMRVKIFFFTVFCFICLSAHAKRFTNQYTEFELPSGWECALEGTEWVRQSSNADRKKEAIIILAAKVRGGQDSLPQYQDYLKKQKTFTLPGGKTQVSESKYANIKDVNGHRWVDALHLASEVPGFYTRYLATVKEDLGVAVTLSVAKDHYSSYQGIFDNIVGSLRVFRQKNQNVANFVKKKDEDLLGDTTFIPSEGGQMDIGAQRKKKSGSGGGGDTTTYAIVAAVVIGAFFLMKKKKK